MTQSLTYSSPELLTINAARTLRVRRYGLRGGGAAELSLQPGTAHPCSEPGDDL